VAGDDNLYSAGCCKLVHIKCQGKNIVTDFYVLPIGGCHMVLGVDLLKTFDAVTNKLQEPENQFTQSMKKLGISGSSVWGFRNGTT